VTPFGIYNYLAEHHAALLAEKVGALSLDYQRARHKNPDQRLQEVYNWSRINMEWLQAFRCVGRGLSAASWNTHGGSEPRVLPASAHDDGDFDLARQTLRLLRKQSDKGMPTPMCMRSRTDGQW